MAADTRHQEDILRNRRVWEAKPLLREVYADFYRRMLALIDRSVPGRIVELGAGLGAMKRHLPDALATDLLPNPWLDLSCDAYELPFAGGRVSHLLMLDVFHHLEWPAAFIIEARRVLAPRGRVILCEPFISLTGFPVYAWLHSEGVRWRQRIDLSPAAPCTRPYYAAQGNATRLFFRREVACWETAFKLVHLEAFAAFAYLLSGGFSRPALYPVRLLPWMQRLDGALSRWPRLFGARCVICLEAKDERE